MAGDAAAERRWIRDVLQRHLGQVGEPSPMPFTGDGFASKLFEVEADAAASLVVKLLPDEPVRSVRGAPDLFANETLFYREVLPFLLEAADAPGDTSGSADVGKDFPRFFCGHGDAFQTLVAVENLAPAGYKLAPKTLDLPHTKLCLQELGKFHALSYLAKKKQPAAFEKLAQRLKPRGREVYEEISKLTNEFLKHAAEQLGAFYPECRAKHAGKLEGLRLDPDTIEGLTRPAGHLAVLCHGDFNRNNVLFRYGDDDGPTSLKFIDFQLVTYSSPAVDVSLLLFLNASPEVRRLHWGELIEAYRGSLLDAVQRGLSCPRGPLDEEFSADALMTDFRLHCLSGFCIAMFFLPFTMLSPSCLQQLDVGRTYNECTPEEIASVVSFVMRNSDEEVKYMLAALLKEALERGFI